MRRYLTVVGARWVRRRVFNHVAAKVRRRLGARRATAVVGKTLDGAPAVSARRTVILAVTARAVRKPLSAKPRAPFARVGCAVVFCAGA